MTAAHSLNCMLGNLSLRGMCSCMESSRCEVCAHDCLHNMQFRFNVKDVEMGTRRPLIVQMVHAPDFDEPQCCLQGTLLACR